MENSNQVCIGHQRVMNLWNVGWKDILFYYNSKITQKSLDFLSTMSSNATVQLATNSSGGIAASWNMVKPMFWPLWTSVENASFHIGRTVFGFVWVLWTDMSSTSTLT